MRRFAARALSRALSLPLAVALAASLAVGTLLLVPATSQADEVLKPTKAYSAFLKAMRKFRGAEKAAQGKERAEAYLEQWKASGKTATGAQRYALAQFQQAAEDYVAAANGFHEVNANTKEKERTRDFAASAEAQLYLFAKLREALGKEAIDKAAARLTAYTAAMDDPSRAKARTKIKKLLARVLDMGGDIKGAYAMRMQILNEDPKSLAQVARPLVQGLLGSTWTMDGYAVMRKQADALMKTLSAKQGTAVQAAQVKFDKALTKLKASDPSALDAAGNLKKTSTRGMSREERSVYSGARSLKTAKALFAKVQGYKPLFGLLGAAAPEWTLEKAYGDVSKLADLKGKVVVLDFWATWPDQCNFPLMRDLLRDYGEKGLSIVGVTVSAKVVYASRYDIDADLRAKAKGGRLFYAARLASEGAPADEDQSIFNEKDYRVHEMETIEAFIKNHELKWPIVQIEQSEPAAKYALEGWPHIVVLDRQGRLRSFRSGEISRDKTEATAAFRKMIEDLLAE